MAETYLTKSYIQTRGAGKKLAKKILNERLRGHATVLGLKGNLGGGKTTFLQGFAKGLGIKEKILSPTFVILKKFKITKIKNQKSTLRLRSGLMVSKAEPSKIKNLRFKNFYHIDCYRIQKPKEILDLGFKDIVSNPKNIIAIEWAERVQTILPQNTLMLRFKFIDKNIREITISAKRKVKNAKPQLKT